HHAVHADPKDSVITDRHRDKRPIDQGDSAFRLRERHLEVRFPRNGIQTLPKRGLVQLEPQRWYLLGLLPSIVNMNARLAFELLEGRRQRYGFLGKIGELGRQLAQRLCLAESTTYFSQLVLLPVAEPR